MHIPLDRLYDFLYGACDHDVIMYRWYPHGSKNLEHLITEYPQGEVNWASTHTKPTVVYHDQEPLNFDLYSREVFTDFFLKIRQVKTNVNSVFLKQHIDQHLRGLFLYNAYDLAVLCHSEKNSKDLEKYQSKGFVGAYYWSHAIIARDWFRYAEYDRRLDQLATGPLFLVYNRSWSGSREYRLKFAESLLDHGLLPHCLTTFNPVDGTHYKHHVFCNSNFKLHRFDLELYFSENTASAVSSADYNSQDYSSARIEVVLETLFDDQRQHLTEKALRPIACGKPFILAATLGSLSYLRDYGFETFSPWINESYDDIVDPVDRLQAIVAEMQRIKNLSEPQQQELLQNINLIAARNKKLFFSDQWIKNVVNEYKQNIDRAVETVKSGTRGKYYNQLSDLLVLEKSPMEGFYKRAQPGVRTQEEMDTFLRLIAYK